MKVYLDDTRPTPEGWVGCRWPEEVVSLLATGLVEELSLDHDLGEPTGRTGYDVLLWLEEEVLVEGVSPPQKITIHSANPAARLRMEQAVKSIYRLSQASAKNALIGKKS